MTMLSELHFDRAQRLRVALLHEWKFHKLAYANATKPSIQAAEALSHSEVLAALLTADEKRESKILELERAAV